MCAPDINIRLFNSLRRSRNGGVSQKSSVGMPGFLTHPVFIANGTQVLRAEKIFLFIRPYSQRIGISFRSYQCWYRHFSVFSAFHRSFLGPNVFVSQVTNSLTNSQICSLMFLFVFISSNIKVIELTLGINKISMLNMFDMFSFCHSLGQSVTDIVLFIFWLIPQEYGFAQKIQ